MHGAWRGVVPAIWMLACSGLPGVYVVDPAAGRDGGRASDAGQVVSDGGTAGDAGPVTALVGPTCFPEIWRPELPNPDYDQFRPAVGAHCSGTAHQDVGTVERLVFLGDSITAGTPPTTTAQFYRSLVTEAVRARMGSSLVVDDCSRIGARVVDVLETQVPQCFTEAADARRTLVVMTIGGNDMADLQREGGNGAPATTTFPVAQAMVERMEETVRFFTDAPDRFPGGISVIFTNLYEYTDGTNDVSACPTAALAGITGTWPEGPDTFIWLNEQWMRIAVETRTDMLFLEETFCGHGWHSDNPEARCYRGPDTPRWFDITCIHPNPTGHAVLAEMFMDVITGG